MEKLTETGDRLLLTMAAEAHRLRRLAADAQPTKGADYESHRGGYRAAEAYKNAACGIEMDIGLPRQNREEPFV